MALPPASLEGSHFDTVVIGAGMAGLAAGIRLALAGRSSILLERHNASGGLNSFYSIDGRKYDVGLHAVTNYSAPGVKGTPLVKLLRQLRIERDALDLSEQCGSRILFPGGSLRFSNNFSLLESEVAEQFPDQIDGFRALAKTVREADAFGLNAPFVSAREIVRRHISDALLEDMIFCPVMYYGSSQPGDMDFGQFAIMFRSLFSEGFARPLEGVRRIIRVLQDHYRSLGGIRKMKCGVRAMQTEGKRVTRLLLDNGESITAERVLSTIGSVETARLCGGLDLPPPEMAAENIGRLSFVETITVFEEQPADLAWEDTIIFFSTNERFRYDCPPPGQLVDPESGVICFPNNYRYGAGRQLPEGLLRITALASHAEWARLDEAEYRAAKEQWFQRLSKVAAGLLPPPKRAPHVLAKDMFTPLTVERFTGHLHGAIYGATRKVKDGRTPYENLFLAGTDQGFLGIIGAMLSGISMANLHCLK